MSNLYIVHGFVFCTFKLSCIGLSFICEGCLQSEQRGTEGRICCYFYEERSCHCFVAVVSYVSNDREKNSFGIKVRNPSWKCLSMHNFPSGSCCLAVGSFLSHPKGFSAWLHPFYFKTPVCEHQRKISGDVSKHFTATILPRCSDSVYTISWNHGNSVCHCYWIFLYVQTVFPRIFLTEGY